MTLTCSYQGCPKPRANPVSELCESHRTQLRRRGELRQLVLTAWTEAEIRAVTAFYSAPIARGDLAAFARTLGRHKTNVSRKARSLSLGTNRKRRYGGTSHLPKIGRAGSPALKAHMSKRSIASIAKFGHPRGMAGKHHTKETRDRLSITSAIAFRHRTKARRRQIVMKAMKTTFAKYGTLARNPRPAASWKAGWREIAGQRIYFRSRWEYNYAVYLQWLVGVGEIVKWEHEPETFWFEGVKRGTCSYLPDFRVTNRNGTIEYHEVKGWMDARSKTKIKRMAKYHPSVKLRVLDAAWFKANRNILRSLPGHESGKHS